VWGNQKFQAEYEKSRAQFEEMARERRSWERKLASAKKMGPLTFSTPQPVRSVVHVEVPIFPEEPTENPQKIQRKAAEKRIKELESRLAELLQEREKILEDVQQKDRDLASTTRGQGQLETKLALNAQEQRALGASILSENLVKPMIKESFSAFDPHDTTGEENADFNKNAIPSYMRAREETKLTRLNLDELKQHILERNAKGTLTTELGYNMSRKNLDSVSHEIKVQERQISSVMKVIGDLEVEMNNLSSLKAISK
jgi:hypothetical protein